jgi:MFS transporter, PHS family, inorganic phosphate transporter
MGFFTDAYDLFSISLLTNILGRIYFQDSPYYVNNTVNPGKLPINYNAAISAVALCGALFGQVLFGALADFVGRRAVYGLSLAIMIHWLHPIDDVRHYCSLNGRHSLFLAFLVGCRSRR